MEHGFLKSSSNNNMSTIQPREIRVVIFALLTCFFTASYSQTVYQPLMCKGDIPEEFSSFYDKSTGSQNADFETMAKLDIHELLKSGIVLFGDTLSSYVRTISDNILKANDINDKVQFYVLRSALYNAFSSDQGYIFITEGAIAQSDNEDQLAFIMCHELAHFLQKHNYQAFEKRKKIDKKKKKKGQETASFIDKLKDYYKYSRSHEFEADSIGLELYLASGYSKEDAIKALNNLSPDAIWLKGFTWDFSYLEDETFKFPEIYKSVDSLHDKRYEYLFDEEEVEKDESSSDLDTNNFSSHPDWEDRVKKVGSFLQFDQAKIEQISDEPLNVSASYAGIKKLAYMESLFHLISNASYVRAHYLCLELEKRYGKSEELTYYKVITLNGVYYKHFHGEDKLSYPTDLVYWGEDSSWNISHMYRFFNALSDKEWMVVLSRLNMQQYLQFKKNKTLELYTTKSLSYMKEEISWSLKKYISPDPPKKVEIEYSTRSKRISKKDIETIRDEYLKSSLLFIQGNDSSKYVRIFDDVVDVQKTNSKIQSRTLDPSYSEFGHSSKHVYKNVDTILVSAPNVQSYTFKNGAYVPTSWLNDSYEKEVHAWREDAAKKNRIALVTNYSETEGKSTVKLWNDNYILESWMREKFLANSFDVIPLYGNMMEGISSKSDNSFYMYSNVIVYGNKTLNNKSSLWLRPVLAPYYVVNRMFKDSPQVLWINILADLETNEIVHIQIEKYAHNFTPDYGRAHVYEQMFQTKRAIENDKIR